MNAKQISNILLRGSTLASKFFLLFFFARLLTVEQVGIYGLMTAAIGWALYIVGFEFYVFSTRSIISENANQVFWRIRDSFLFYIVIYALFTPAFISLLFWEIIPTRYAVYFCTLLILEHLGLEAGRILVAIGHPLVASISMFFRGGAWGIIVILLMWFQPEYRNLDFAFIAWMCGSILGLIFSAIKLFQLKTTQMRRDVDWNWIITGCKIAVPLVLASIATRGLFTIDRFWIEAVFGDAELGSYVLFISIGISALTFLDAGVVDFAYPRIVRAVNNKQHQKFLSQIKRMLISVLALLASVLYVIYVATPILVQWLGNPIYADHLYLLPWILSAVAVCGISTVPHVALYAHHRDKSILFSQLAGLTAFILFTSNTLTTLGLVGIPMGLLFAFSVILILKSIMCLKIFSETVLALGNRETRV